jgi:hypothetical protein
MTPHPKKIIEKTSLPIKAPKTQISSKSVLPHTDLEIDGVKEYIFDTIRGAG